MVFKNKSNVGNTTFIPMNKYMLSSGLNDNRGKKRLTLNDSLIFSDFNNNIYYMTGLIPLIFAKIF